MRALNVALSAALTTPGAVPDLKLELAAIWPRFADAGGWSGTGPTGSVIAPDGAVISAYISTGTPQTVYARRVTDPTNAGQWGAWTTISADGRGQTGVGLCVAGATVRLLWQAGASTGIFHADSLDSGISWSAPALLFDPAARCAGLAADGDLSLVLVAYDALGLGSIRLAVWKLAGSWSHTDWPNGDQNTIVGIAASSEGGGAYAVALALQGATGEAYSIQTTTVSTGGSPVWAPLSLVIPVDTSTGLTVRYPQLSQFDGAYRLAYQLEDSGVVSGVAYTRVARTRSADFIHWQAPLEDEANFPSGAAWLRHATCTLLVAAEAVRRAPLYDPAVDYHDLTADLSQLDLIEREGAPAKLVVTLDNSTGAYTTLPALAANAQLLLSQGIAGAGLVPTHLLYVDQWTLTRAADLNQITIVASDRLRFLERAARTPISYANQTVAAILADLAAVGGFDAAAAIDTAGQFSQSPALFQVPAGHPYHSAIARLLAVYDGTFRARAVPGAGPAFAAIDVPTVAGKNSAQPAVWSTPAPGSGALDEVEYLHLTQAGERANHLVVYGPQHAAAAMAEAWDFPDAAAVGQERYALIVEGFAANSAEASLLAGLALAREQRLALQVSLAIGAHPGLELGDVIAITDQIAPPTNGRIVALSRAYQALESLHELVLGCEGV
ncbi:MAG TPA: hypothetical protein VN837_21730 [Chloroflexota bacterium]|nr:hypothetical protein [Chloroflexota bacterium]